MEGTRNSVSPNSELGIPSMFATYDETPPSAQPWLHTYSQSPNFFEGLHQPQQDSVYYVHNPYTQASSSASNDDHELDEEHERQSSLVEEPRPEVHRRNPTRNRRRPRTQIQDPLHFHSSYTPPSRFVFSAPPNPCRSGYFPTKATARRPCLSLFASPLGVAIKRRSSGMPLPFLASMRTVRLRSQVSLILSWPCSLSPVLIPLSL
ncbi:hypothetical protein DEO72_LG4g1120 [Vigna unguiculata]|uniref:Uncharacterized protein n=1 Tax=Vigna unguiculata TaxID=3917 RepID=A0A4D6LP59_VIGUN|nr:hypothetical protein DEO72_LG4g1120 [Vigna unguiculata]